MNTVLLIAAIFMFLGFVYFGYRYLSIQRALKNYLQGIRRASAAQAPPKNVRGLENLSNTISTLFSTLHNQLTTSDAERSRLATVLDQMTDGVLIVDSSGKIQFANPAAGRLFASPNVVNRGVVEVVRSHQLVDAWRRCQQTREMQTESVELPVRRQFLQMVAIPDLHDSGSILLVQDLTRVRKLETVRRDFISNVSHELRTPLASLKALTETLQAGALADPGAGPRFLGRISTEVDALTQMAQELLDLSRIESGQVELVLAPLSPRNLLSSAAERMKMQVERANLTLTLLCDTALPTIRADQSRLEQVLVNLIHNSVKFSRSGGEVILMADITKEEGVENGGIRFAVKDSGIGISADDLSRIFERFYKSDRSRAGGGTGLGLSIARHIVEAHGGRIWAESKTGLGSTFFFTIPVV
jgi:two-component system phosphate regulon sensor histidine kinase PhoR